ncbi:hypothetical protein DACRYDRAFT_23012 [Dacryopinax primogenitus]|uniref:RNA polymerase II degradation factor 1 n=1 Tax=Dacryopinax primogenitus (strain DJM 731) TaxID=1858805 RepID=M5G9Q6_DACPD|nr:uncharacterized protein DACRYDRAFT_23012 [Dacryopinax primogenitus]EJU00558.1 hypothetical protein DACRYDRAFT_23012 [Dacryopinax primogenitus]
MSQKVANTRPPRPYRGSWKSGSRSTNPSNAYTPPAADEPEELRVLKGKHADALKIMREMYPDWTDEDVLFLLEEVQGDVEVAVSRITEGHAERWSQTTKKKEKKHTAASIPANGKGTPEGAPNGHTFAGGRGMRGGRGGGRGGFTGVSRGGRGGLVGGRGGARKHDAEAGSAPAPAPAGDVPGATDNGWGPPNIDVPSAEATAMWGPVDQTATPKDWNPISLKQKNNILAWAKGGDKTGWEDSKVEEPSKEVITPLKGVVTAAPTTAAEVGSAPGIPTPAPVNGKGVSTSAAPAVPAAPPVPVHKSAKVPAAPKLSWAQIAKPQPKPTPPPAPVVVHVAPPPLPTPPISDETPLPLIPVSKNATLDEPEEPTTIPTEPAWALAEPTTTVGEIGTDAGDEENLGGETWEPIDKVVEPEPVTTVGDLDEPVEEPVVTVSQAAEEPPKTKLPVSPTTAAAVAPPGLAAPKAKPNVHPRSSSARFKIGDDSSALPATARWASPGMSMMFGSLKVGDDSEEVPAPIEQAPAPQAQTLPAPAPAPAPVPAGQAAPSLPVSQSQPLPPKPELPQAAPYQPQPVVPPQPAGLPLPAAPQPTASAAAGLSNVQHLFNASLVHPPPASAPVSGSLQTQQSQAQHLPPIPSQPPHLPQQHAPSYQASQPQPQAQPPSYLAALQQSSGGLPLSGHIDSHSALPPTQIQQQHAPLAQQAPTSTLGQNYFRQEQQQQYYHAPTPPQAAPSQQDHLPSSYGGFGAQGGQGNLPGFGGSGGLGNDYQYGASDRGFYDSYNQNNFRNLGHDDHKLPTQPSQASLQAQQPLQNQQQQPGAQSHTGPNASSQQPAGQNQPGQGQQQQFPGMPAPAPYYYPSPYYMQNQYYGQPMPGYGQPFVQFPKYGGPPAQAPSSKPAPAQNTSGPYGSSYHPGQSAGLGGYDDAAPTGYGGASNSLDFKYNQGLQNFLGVPGGNSSLLGTGAGAGNQPRGSNLNSGPGGLQDRYTAAQSVDKTVPAPSQGAQLGQTGRPGVGTSQAGQQGQGQQGAGQQQGGGYYGNRYGNTPQNQNQGGYPPQGDNQYYQHYGQRQYWQQ